MRFLHVLTICALALAGCATKPPAATATTPTSKVAPLRDDCPKGYGYFIDERGTACWKGGNHGPPWTLGEIPPASCQPFRCPDSGYLFWDCPEPPQSGAAVDPELQAQLERAAAKDQCLRRMGAERVRKVALPGPPGDVLSLSLSEGPEHRSYYYYRRGQDGRQYICPFKGAQTCLAERVPKDQECADYSQCLEVCLDEEGRVIW